jgi:hypothetical protein
VIKGVREKMRNLLKEIDENWSFDLVFMVVSSVALAIIGVDYYLTIRKIWL